MVFYSNTAVLSKQKQGRNQCHSMLIDIKQFFSWTGDNHGQTVILALSFVLLCDLILVFNRCMLSISPTAWLGLVKTIVWIKTHSSTTLTTCYEANFSLPLKERRWRQRQSKFRFGVYFLELPCTFKKEAKKHQVNLDSVWVVLENNAEWSCRELVEVDGGALKASQLKLQGPHRDKSFFG